MSTVTLKINGKEIKTKEGRTILEAARESGIEIPTLCYHEKLAPYGACRLCSVEIIRNKSSRIVASCIYPIEEGLIVETNSPRVIKIRKMLIELMLAIAPGVKVVDDLAAQYGVQGTRFKTEPNFCLLCGLCVRYCTEVKKANALGFAGRGISRRVVFIPEIASKVCMSCRECFSICPTAKIPRETDGVCFTDLTIDDFISKQGK
jgi:NADH dehydrogenase/NADH:ubiquinone oxidoreductase subunit G